MLRTLPSENGVGPSRSAGAGASGAPRRGRPGYDRDALIQVCVETFNRHGYDATSMGVLARELGISKSAIYHHVSSKEEILAIALTRSLAELEEVVADAAELGLSAAAEVETIVRESVRVLIRSLPYVTLLLRLRGNSELEVRALQRRREITLRISDLIEQAQREGDMDDAVDPRTASRLAMGMVNSMVDWYSPKRVTSVGEFVETVVQMALGGLRKRPERA